MKESKQRRSIRLKLEQPAIMCAGRKPVECYYRGKVAFEFYNVMHVEIKSYGKPVTVCFEDGLCITEGWEDLKII